MRQAEALILALKQVQLPREELAHPSATPVTLLFQRLGLRAQRGLWRVALPATRVCFVFVARIDVRALLFCLFAPFLSLPSAPQVKVPTTLPNRRPFPSSLQGAQLDGTPPPRALEAMRRVRAQTPFGLTAVDSFSPTGPPAVCVAGFAGLLPAGFRESVRRPDSAESGAAFGPQRSKEKKSTLGLFQPRINGLGTVTAHPRTKPEDLQS